MQKKYNSTKQEQILTNNPETKCQKIKVGDNKWLNKFTLPCFFNLLNVSDSPIALEAVRAAIGTNRLDWTTEILRG